MSNQTQTDAAQRQRFETMMATHQGMIRAFLRRLCKHNHALADDLAQETFIRAFHKMGDLQKEGAQKAWLFQIAYRIFLDHFRKAKRRDQISQDNALGQYADAALGDPSSAHHIYAVRPNLKMDIERAMDQLSEPQRAILMMNISYGLSHGEIAKTLKMPLGSVKSHIARAKTALKSLLNVYEGA